jgi:hypothetical protein
VSLDSPDAVDFGKNGSNPDKSKGLIEAHFHFEKEAKKAEEHHHHHYHDWPWWLPSRPYNPQPGPYGPYWRGNRLGTCGTRTSNITRGMSYGMSLGNDNLNDSLDLCDQSVSYSANAQNFNREGLSANSIMACSAKPLQDGCTVEGSYTGQSFNSMYLDYESEATVLKIFLQGFEPGVVAVQSTQKPSPLRRKKSTETEADCEDAELKALREKNVALQKEIELLKAKALEKELAQLKTSS